MNQDLRDLNHLISEFEMLEKQLQNFKVSNKNLKLTVSLFDRWAKHKAKDIKQKGKAKLIKSVADYLRVKIK